jgi:hypothetical protein
VIVVSSSHHRDKGIELALQLQTQSIEHKAALDDMKGKFADAQKATETKSFLVCFACKPQ